MLLLLSIRVDEKCSAVVYKLWFHLDMVWHGGSTLVSISIVSLRWAPLILR